MARIAGVDLPRNKHIEIALTYIFGVGSTTAKQLLDKANIDGATRTDQLSESEVQRIRELIARAIDLVVHLDRLPDGTRRIMGITEVLGIEGSVITAQDIFVFEQGGLTESGKIRGQFKATGVRPAFAEKLQQHGITLPADLFRYRKDVP